MDAVELCRSLTSLMRHEVGLLERMVSYQLTLKESIVSHSWTRLDLAQRKIGPVLQGITEVEEQRHEVFGRLRSAVGEDAEAGFYEVVVHLERSVREEAADVYRSLKFTVLKIQGISSSIEIYLKTVTAAMQEILAELFPFRKGNIYTRKGTTTQVRSNPMVISRRL